MRIAKSSKSYFVSTIWNLKIENCLNANKKAFLTAIDTIKVKLEEINEQKKELRILNLYGLVGGLIAASLYNFSYIHSAFFVALLISFYITGRSAEIREKYLQERINKLEDLIRDANLNNINK